MTEDHFPTRQNDPEFVELAARLMKATSPTMTAWLTELMVERRHGKDVAQAFAMTIGIHLSLIATYAAKSGSADLFIESVTTSIRAWAIDAHKSDIKSPSDIN